MAVIRRYLVDVYGGEASDGLRARIDLVGERSLVGTIRFYGAGHALPEDTLEDGCGVQMHARMDAFAGALALLQHDRPVHVELVQGRARLFTSEQEGVGEPEG